MTTSFGQGLHSAPGRPVSSSAYDRYIGRWSRLFIPTMLTAAGVVQGHRLLDVATGTGEAARIALPIVGSSGFVVGADISLEMVKTARNRLNEPSYLPVAANGQALPFADGTFDALVCQLGLQFFPNPAAGLIEFRRVLRPGAVAAVCVISTPDRAPMWGNLADALSRFLPQQRNILQMGFSLADPNLLELLFNEANFTGVRVEQVWREDVVESFDDYWAPIEAGIGSIPQAYHALGDSDRRSVRDEVRARLTPYESSDGKLHMGVEMLIGSGRA